MRGWTSTRLGVALVVAGVLAGSLAGPVSAATTERWVDDDSSPGDGPAACDTAAFSSIQAAIDASNDWDHVNVCPGYYEEQLTLDVRGILVQSVRLRKAHIVAPPLMTEVDGVTSLVRMTEWAARLYGFRIDIPAGDVILPPVLPSCSPVDVAVLALGERNRVRWNVIDATGDATFSGSCGYAYGIVFTDAVLPSGFGAPYPIETSRATHNVVRDFKWGGILVEGARKARVDHNTVRFLHADDTGCFETATVESAVGPQGICIPSTVAPTDVNSAFPLAFGIGVEDEALADIQRNTVESNNLAAPTLGPSISLWSGIHLRDADGDSRVRGNTVSGTFTGVTVDSGTVTISPTAATAGPEIAGNTASNSFAGFEIEQDASHVHHNRAFDNVFGITVLSSDNDVHDNDFRGNDFIDCGDLTLGTGTAGTANLWTDNLGNTSAPVGLCTADPV